MGAAVSALALSACCFAPAAFATSYTVYNYNSDPNSNIQEQTIVGEGANNNVIVTNTANNPPSATGFIQAYAPAIGIGIVIVCAGVLIYVNSRRKAALLDEEESE